MPGSGCPDEAVEWWRVTAQYAAYCSRCRYQATQPPPGFPTLKIPTVAPWRTPSPGVTFTPPGTIVGATLPPATATRTPTPQASPTAPLQLYTLTFEPSQTGFFVPYTVNKGNFVPAAGGATAYITGRYGTGLLPLWNLNLNAVIDITFTIPAGYSLESIYWRQSVAAYTASLGKDWYYFEWEIRNGGVYRMGGTYRDNFLYTPWDWVAIANPNGLGSIGFPQAGETLHLRFGTPRGTINDWTAIDDITLGLRGYPPATSTPTPTLQPTATGTYNRAAPTPDPDIVYDCSEVQYRNTTPIIEFAEQVEQTGYSCYTLVPELDWEFGEWEIKLDGTELCVAWIRVPNPKIFGIPIPVFELIGLMGAWAIAKLLWEF